MLNLKMDWIIVCIEWVLSMFLSVLFFKLSNVSCLVMDVYMILASKEKINDWKKKSNNNLDSNRTFFYIN